MPVLDGEDPIVVAALLDDDDDEESKALTKEFLDQADSDDDEVETPAGEEDDDDGDDTDDPDPKDDPADKDEVDDEEKPNGEKPPEAIDAKKDDDVEIDKPKGDDDAEKKSRSERRAERQRKYLERLSAAPVDENEKRRRELLKDDYKPLDIKDGEYEPDDLIKDRQQYAQSVAIKTAEAQREVAEEQNFWTKVEYEAKLLNTKPGFEFLDETNKEKFDEKKAAAVNDLYFKVIGLENQLVRDANGLPVVNAQGEAMIRPTVRRKDLGFQEFVEGYVENMMDFDQDNEAEITKNIVKQRAHQGIRPGGSSRRGLGRLRQGDISKMSADEVDANEAEIDRQINAELGIS